MRLSALKGQIRTLEIPVEGEEEPVKVQYRPGDLTLEIADAMRAAVDQGVEERVVLVFLSEVLVSWDLEDEEYGDDGQVSGSRTLSVEPEDIKKVPVPFLAQVMLAIQEDARPNPPTDGNSSAILQPEEPSDTSQTGTSLFPQPDSTESPLGSS